MIKKIQLFGRVFFKFDILAVTGLHIGGSDTGIEIGGVDKTVIRDPLTNRPYIPGSTFKGKTRSLLEKYYGLKQNQRIGQGYIHSCGAEYRKEELSTQGKQEYLNCDVCQVFGVPGERDFSSPTRLIVRDIQMTNDSANMLNEIGRTDLPYTEVKTEVSIDRVTSAANPRQLERIPAGTIFGPAELIYSIYTGNDCNAEKDIYRIKTIIEGFQLLEDDYLGGSGTRGSGKVKLKDFSIHFRPQSTYIDSPVLLLEADSINELTQNLGFLQESIKKHLNKAV